MLQSSWHHTRSLWCHQVTGDSTDVSLFLLCFRETGWSVLVLSPSLFTSALHLFHYCSALDHLTCPHQLLLSLLPHRCTVSPASFQGSHRNSAAGFWGKTYKTKAGWELGESAGLLFWRFTHTQLLPLWAEVFCGQVLTLHIKWLSRGRAWKHFRLNVFCFCFSMPGFSLLMTSTMRYSNEYKL